MNEFRMKRQIEFLALVEERLEEALQLDEARWDTTSAGLLDRASRHICQAPKAKRARPKLVFLFGKALDLPKESLVDVAVAVELIHTASLLHDDVVDEGTIRRGIATVNAKWNNLVAVLTGDLMLSTALLHLENHSPELMKEAIRVVRSMTRSAILEAQSRGRIDISSDEWKQIALGKTGILFGWCGLSCAVLARDTEARQRFIDCAHHLGLAFQMADDLQDAQNPDSGKNAFADIQNRNPSFLLLKAAELSPKIRTYLQDAWQRPETLASEEVHALGMQMLATGADELIRKEVGHQVVQAIDALGPYLDRPGCQEIAIWAQALWRGVSPSADVNIGAFSG